MSFSRLLIANRGEIAVRIIRACRELGIESVAVYSEADEGSMHRRLADEAYSIGPAPASESYLNIERISGVIRESGAEAVHPGYGFLAENAAFARTVEESGAVWVGPPPEAMELMGDKVRAKELARRADVPTVPGYSGEDQSEERLAEEAKRIGYPILVKASAGGGGRGMRAVHRPEGFEEAVRGAKREAEASFGEGSVFIEKLLEEPRHVEVQVIGDKAGEVAHLYERECSIQRRHQKVVEEAPSSALTSDLREAICGAAVRLAEEAGYHNAGTVEFLLEGEEFYFLEMNARLQVEHPVTELATGLDLVRLQLAVAAGEPLPIKQEDVTLRGSAIEVRLYAEDGGVPTGGRVRALSLPEGPGVRNDAGVEVGDEVPTNYDPMFAKLIVHAPDRRLAVARLRRALHDYEVLGFPTNLPLLDRIADHPAFAAGETTTRFLEEHRLTEPPEESEVPEKAILLAAAGELSRGGASPDPFSRPWRLLGAVTLHYRVGEEEVVVEAGRTGAGVLSLRMGGREFGVEVLSNVDGRISAVVDGEPVSGVFATGDSETSISLGGESYRLFRPLSPDVDGVVGADEAAASLTAPMPGTVVKVLVGEGEEVEEGQLLLVLEAMKMEQPFTAPHAGVVRSLPYGEGALVPGGAVLAEVEEVEEAARV
ncbi:MAG TPA: biotin carboxylase N-terminal domain-containing protein [Rubrobacteraceae bacterium]|nr:biotin carboxylase N-terminal domain-containing protein [Rubrobacteraceae bacterium]